MANVRGLKSPSFAAQWDWPVLPVVSRADLGELEGILTLPTILAAFRQGPTDPTASPYF
jgi:hypothetical protein